MSVIILGCGRSGTNMLLEVMRGHPRLKATRHAEDKRFADAGRVFPANYLSKCDTWYCSTSALRATLKSNPDLRVLWAIRNPKDICLSKIRRGQLKDNGGDATGQQSLDSTETGCIESIEGMFVLHQLVRNEFQDRMLVVKMEDIICNTKEEAKRICAFLDLPFEEKMVDFPSRMRCRPKAERYGGKVDKSQVDLWKRWAEVYDGFFKKASIDVEKLFISVEYITSYFGY